MFTKKLAKQITSLVLCTMLMLLMVVPGFAAENEGNVTTLKSLRFVDLIETLTKVDSSGVPLAENAEGFSPDHFNYSAKFPYVKDTDSFYVPEIEADTTDDNATYEVTNSDITKGAITIVVTAENKVATQTYTIIGETVGENMYVDGGFEGLLTADDKISLEDTAGNTVWSLNKAKNNTSMSISATRQEYASGVKSMLISKVEYNTYYYGKFKGNSQGLSANKKYYGALQAKLPNDASQSSFVTRILMKHLPSTNTVSNIGGTKTIYDGEGNVRDGSTNAHPTVYRDKWSEYALVITPDADTNSPYFVVNQTGNDQPNYLVDDYYLSELVISKVAVTNASGASNESIPVAELTGNKMITLSAKALNQYGNAAGLEQFAVTEWKVAEEGTGITVDNGTVTVPAGTPAGEYHIEACVDADAVTTAGQGVVKGVYTINISAGSLTSLEVSAPHVIDFKTGTLSYTLDVPVVHVNGQDTYTMPVVSATSKAGCTVDVVYPKAVTDGAQILVNVKDKDGNQVDTYTLTLNTIGENLYVDGDFENGVQTRANNTGAVKGSTQIYGRPNSTPNFTVTADYGATGSKALKLEKIDGSANWWGLLNQDLAKNKKYYASMQLKIPADAKKGDGATPFTAKDYETRHNFGSHAFSYMQHYDGDGNKKLTNEGADKAHTTLYTDSWTTAGAVFDLSAATTDKKFYQRVTMWSDAHPDIVVDDYYVGELVVSEVAITTEDADITNNIATPAEDTTINFTSKLLNQYQTVAGLEDINTTLSLVNAPEGVTLAGSALTIPKGTVGEITVRADAVLTGLTQKAVYGEISIVVGETGITGTADEAKLVYVNNTGKSVPVLFYVALYEKNENGTLKFVSGTPKTGTCTADTAIYSDTQTITVPNDGKAYVVKAFAWKNDGTYSPLMKSETLR